MTTDEVKAQAFELVAEFLAQTDEEITKEQFLKDLTTYSSPEVEVHERFDHYEYVLQPSIGDEAGYWTLYVIVASGGGYGMVNDEMAQRFRTDVIRAMWEVFDTTPIFVYSLEETWDEEKKHSVSVPTWHLPQKGGA